LIRIGHSLIVTAVCSLMHNSRYVCSNCAATLVNNLKTREMLHAETVPVCRNFANSVNVLKSVVLP
jgi:hypothetical protein